MPPKAPAGPEVDPGGNGATSRDNTPLSAEARLAPGDTPRQEGPGRTAPAEPQDVDLSSRIADLIDRQVSSGHLTADQASELTKLFSAGNPARSAGTPSPGAADPAATPAAQPSQDTDSLVSSFVKQIRTQQPQGYNAKGSIVSPTAALVIYIKV